eukprot:5434610-Pyramimonas_sp.AAC.1
MHEMVMTDAGSTVSSHPSTALDLLRAELHATSRSRGSQGSLEAAGSPGGRPCQSSCWAGGSWKGAGPLPLPRAPRGLPLAKHRHLQRRLASASSGSACCMRRQLLASYGG